MREEISPAALSLGDIIVKGRGGTVVKKLAWCTTRGVPKIHVNDTDCYDSIATILVQRKKENASGECTDQDS